MTDNSHHGEIVALSEHRSISAGIEARIRPRVSSDRTDGPIAAICVLAPHNVAHPRDSVLVNWSDEQRVTDRNTTTTTTLSVAEILRRTMATLDNVAARAARLRTGNYLARPTVPQGRLRDDLGGKSRSST